MARECYSLLVLVPAAKKKVTSEEKTKVPASKLDKSFTDKPAKSNGQQVSQALY